MDLLNQTKADQILQNLKQITKFQEIEEAESNNLTETSFISQAQLQQPIIISNELIPTNPTNKYDLAIEPIVTLKELEH